MKLTATILVSLVGILHVWFMVLESFLWTTPIGRKTFHMTAEMAESTKVLAQNQGLYNGFLAAGCFWAAYSGDVKVNVFFLTCIIIAGIVGGITANRNIILVQSVPAMAALIIVLLNARG